MPSLFNILVCTLALLVGFLGGKKVREWKDRTDPNWKERGKKK